MNFEFFALEISFEAKDSIFFAHGKSGNILRGAFGTLFQHHPAYRDFFEPSPRAPAPSGLKNLPRPFVFRAAHLDGSTLKPGERFHFQIHLFCALEPARSYFEETFAQLAVEGIGPRRGRAQLLAVDARPIVIPLDPTETAQRLRVRFLTPTELKDEGRTAPRPEFEILFARARDRVSTLRAAYGPGPLRIDFAALRARAAAVRTTRCDLVYEEIERHSSKTGQTHPLGGFTGEAEYEGELREFLPILRAAQWTGVGRQTVWGKGQIELRYS